MKKSIAVLGMGRFGINLATSLYDMGSDVMVADKNPEIIDKLSDKVTYAMNADLSDADALKGLGLEDMDVVVVAMGSDLTASIMSVMIAKEAGVKLVLAKASDERMGEILLKVGADRILQPEEEGGRRCARVLTSDSFLEFFNVDDNLGILEMRPKDDWVGKNLIELNLREKYHVNVVAIRDNDKMRAFIDPTKPLEADTDLLVVVEKNDIKKLMNK